MKAAVEQVFNGSMDQVAIGGTYDATKINRGKHTGQFNLGSGDTDKFVGPAPLGVASFGESPLAITSAYIHPVQITDDLFWVFGADGATAAATRRVQLWTFVPSTNTYALQGAVTLTFPTATAHTVRGFRAILENYTTGTVGVSGTAVTGTGTAWLTGLSVGSRIGFGSTDPTAITTWFQISAIGSNTSITLTGSAGTIAEGTPYVIQDLMLVHANTNATATSGGLFITKGLQWADFQSPATAIPAATTVDKIKATYWLKDAATVTNTTIGGCALGDKTSWTEQYVYSTNGASTSLSLYRYNIRAPLTLTAGAMVLTGSDMVITGSQAVTGTISQSNNGRVATLAHGAGAGVPSIYLFTTTRILRVPLASVTTGSTTFVADSMSEVPPGGTNTNVATAAFTALDVAGSLDKLVITGAASSGTVYITDYYTGGQQMDRRSGALTAQLPSALRDTDSPIFVRNIAANVPFIWVEDGWLFWIYSQGATTNVNALTVYPLAADLGFNAEVNNRIICPKITLGATPSKFYRALVNCVENLGDDTMGVTPDMFRLQYRTSGIDDNSGSWVDVPQTGDLSGVSTSANIQFAFQFRTAGVIMLPARVSIYRADTDALVLTQASSGSANGVFEHWTGSAWAAGLGSDAIDTRRRFVPSGSLPGGVDLYAKLTVA